LREFPLAQSLQAGRRQHFSKRLVPLVVEKGGVKARCAGGAPRAIAHDQS
jgi:hypothetical protein